MIIIAADGTEKAAAGFTLDPSAVTLIIGIITLAGTIAAAFAPAVIKRIRGANDVRDDKTAETATLKSAAEVAMELVDKTREWADHLINSMQTQIVALTAQITRLEGDLASARAELRALQATPDHGPELAEVRARATRLQTERDAALREVERLTAIVEEARRKSAGLTFSTDEVAQRRAEKVATGEIATL